MKILFKVIFLFCCTSLAKSQSFHPDSLLEKGNELLYENPKRAISLVEPILHSGNQNQVFEACYLMGDCHYLLGNFDEALKLYENCVLIGESEQDDDQISRGYLGIGTIYSENDNPDLAFEYYFKSLEIREKLDDKLATANVLNNISVLFHNQGKYEKAISYMHQVNQIDRELNDSISLGYSYSNLGAFHYFNDNSDSALFYHNKALNIRSALGDEFQMSRSMNNLANVFVDLGEMNKALSLYEQAINLRRKLKNDHELALSLNNAGESLVSNEEFGLALPYLEEANSILEELDDINMERDNSLNLARVYAELGRYKVAYSMLRKTYDLSKQMFDEAKSRQTEEMMAKFETEQTKKENEALRAKRAEDSLDLEKSKNKSYLLIGGIIILALLAFMILTKLRTNKRNTQKLKNLYDQLEESNTNILDSINYAQRIQNAILPTTDKLKESLSNSFVLYQPKDVVAGDFYWFKRIENKIHIAAADCTGHGVPGALVSVVCSNALNRSVHEFGIGEPAEILNATRDIVVSEFGSSPDNVKDGMDIALCTIENNTLKFSGANNPLWVVRKGKFDQPESSACKIFEQDGYALLEVKGDKQPVGKFEKSQPFAQHSISLQKGDSIYLFSDGFIDQFGGDKQKKFKSTNFRKLIFKAQAHEQMTQQGELLQKVFNEWKMGIEQLDDVCVIGFKLD